MFEDVYIGTEIMQAYIDAFKTVPDAPHKVFSRHGLGLVDEQGQFELVDRVPLDKWLLATNELMALVAPQKAFDIGTSIIDRATVPPTASDIQSALQLFDVAYHLNHWKDGKPMFDAETGTVVDGIGHYNCTYLSKRRAVVEVDAPYQCDVDRGIIQGWARRFEKTALVTHLDLPVCRKNRSRACRYEVSWK